MICRVIGCRELYKGMNSSLYVNISSESLNSSGSDDPERLKVSCQVGKCPLVPPHTKFPAQRPIFPQSVVLIGVVLIGALC